MPPLIQLSALLAVYLLHVIWLSRVTVPLPWPIRHLDLAADNLIGGAIVVAYAVRRRSPLLRSLRRGRRLAGAPPRDLPWAEVRMTRGHLLQTSATLIICYLLSGYAAALFDGFFSLLSVTGILALSTAQRAALQVLCSHLFWVWTACRVLGNAHAPFFPPRGRFFSLSWRRHLWVWWAIGGYFASVVAYNAVEVVNRVLVPPPPIPATPLVGGGGGAAPLPVDDSVVSRLVSPEGGDITALGIGAVGPCLTAPVFEEILYRGFLLPAFASFMPLWRALTAQAAVFALHHHALPALLPLTALGWLWGTLYARSGNLLVAILIHALWNGRIFLNSLLDLLGYAG
jgi:membrane protease YdiL (CAAX protease family)